MLFQLTVILTNYRSYVSDYTIVDEYCVGKVNLIQWIPASNENYGLNSLMNKVDPQRDNAYSKF